VWEVEVEVEVTVGRRIAAVGRRAVRTTTAAVSPLAVALAIFALAAFALAALVNELNIGWPWWVVASVIAVASTRLWRVLPFVGLLTLNLATAFALAALADELNIGWPWWVVASVIAVASTVWSRWVSVSFTWPWGRRERTRKRTRGSGSDDDTCDVLPRKNTPLIATIIGLFAVSAGVPGLSTSLANSSPGSILVYAVPVGLGVLSFVMGLMLARYRRKQLDIIRQSFVRQIEDALMGGARNDIDYLIRQRDALIASGDVSDATDMSGQIREVLVHTDVVKN